MKTLSMTLTRSLLLSSAGLFASTCTLHAQVKTPAPSPFSELKQVVGVTEFTIQYSRPGVKGREIYGGLVPFDQIWRTGANATTKIAFDSEIDFGGKTIPAGEYVLFTIPGEDEWTLIVYGDTQVANAGLYDPKDDVARITVKPVGLEKEVESFTIGFDHLRDGSATLYLDWAKTRVPVETRVDTAALSLASIEASLDSMDTWTARDYASAATYYAEHGEDLDKATKWMGRAASMNEGAYWWQHRYAKMLADQGEIEAAIAAAEKSLATAKASEGGDNGYIKRNEELLATLQ